MVKVAEETEPKCEQRDCPMNENGQCVEYKGYKWETFGTEKCKAQTKSLTNYWGGKIMETTQTAETQTTLIYPNPEIHRSIRYRVNISVSVKGIKTWENTVDAEGYSMDEILAESDKLCAELSKRYPPQIEGGK